MLVSKDVLEELYILKNLPMHTISKNLNIAIGTVHKYLHKYNIPTRDKNLTFTMKGRKLNKEQCQRISELHKGKKISKETKYKMSDAKKLKNKSGHKKRRTDGYIYTYFPSHPEASKDGYIMEHRLVMENILGRYLSKNEIIHHINKNRSDNRPENLMIFNSLRDHRMYHHYFKNMEEFKNAQ